jgi:hypothetical protein
MRKVLFRVDDVGLDNDRFQHLMDIFISYDIPFAAGLIPVKEFPKSGNYDLVSFFQHGHRHVNRSVEAKKNEFPENIQLEQCLEEISLGWQLMKKTNLPLWKAFCPPWNTMRAGLGHKLLQDYFLLGGKEIESTNRSLPYHVDLHTKEPKPQNEEVLLAIENVEGIAVIMLHHTFMGPSDFTNLNHLLKTLKDASCTFINAKEDL